MKKLILCFLLLFCLFVFSSECYSVDNPIIILIPQIGDVDSNGSVDSADARLILRLSVGLEFLNSEKQFELSDFDGDGKITPADARLVLRKAVKLDEGLNKGYLNYTIEREQPNEEINVFFDRIVLSGNYNGIEEINNDIKQRCDDFISTNYDAISEVFYYFESIGAFEDRPYLKNVRSYTELLSAYSDGKYLSIHFHLSWWAAGVNNTNHYGLNYDLETGEVITLSDFYEKYNKETVRQNILKSVYNDRKDEIHEFSKIDKPLEDINFYFYDNTIAINYGPYEFGFGGWSRTMEYPISRFATNSLLYDS